MTARQHRFLRAVGDAAAALVLVLIAARVRTRHAPAEEAAA